MHIVPYEYIDAERLRFGHFPVLDTILYRWTRRIEETLFEQAGVQVYAGASVFEEMKFSTYFATLRRPRPIYFLGLEPLQGTGLFVVDNRFSAFCLRGGARGAVDADASDEVRLTQTNQARLQRVVEALLADFDACWADVHPIRTHLRKVTTYPFRARILNPYETCLVAQIHLAGHNISSRLTWCLPRPMLEPALPRLSEHRVLPPVQVEAQPGDRPSRATVMRWLNYGLQVRMGQLSVPTAAEHLAEGAVLPLDVEPNNEAVVELDGTPVLRASVGAVEGHVAFRVDGPYRPPTERSPIADASQFQPLRWPEASAE